MFGCQAHHAARRYFGTELTALTLHLWADAFIKLLAAFLVSPHNLHEVNPCLTAEPPLLANNDFENPGYNWSWSVFPWSSFCAVCLYVALFVMVSEGCSRTVGGSVTNSCCTVWSGSRRREQKRPLDALSY